MERVQRSPNARPMKAHELCPGHPGHPGLSGLPGHPGHPGHPDSLNEPVPAVRPWSTPPLPHGLS